MLLRMKTIIRLYCQGKHPENELHRTFRFLFTAWVSFGLALVHGTDFTHRASVGRPTPASAELSGKKAAPLSLAVLPESYSHLSDGNDRTHTRHFCQLFPLCWDPQSFLCSFYINSLSISKSGLSLSLFLPVLRVYINYLFLSPY